MSSLTWMTLPTWKACTSRFRLLIIRPLVKGRQQGYEKGRLFGKMEGRALGREKGFDLWNELGYYKGVITVYKRMIQSQATTTDDAARKKQRQWQQLDSFEALWSLIPQQNDSSNHDPPLHQDNTQADSYDFGKLLERVRARFRLVCKILGFNPPHASLSHMDTSGASLTPDSPSQNMVRLAGQLVDQKHLHY